MGRNAGSICLAAIEDNSLRLLIFKEALDLVLLSGTVAAVEPDLPISSISKDQIQIQRTITQVLYLPQSSHHTATTAHPIAAVRLHYRYYW